MKVLNREQGKDILENQILQDSKDGDTTILAEIISSLTDEELWGYLSEYNQNTILDKLK